MPGITGQGTTFNLPNFVGELFAATPEDTPLVSAIGGLSGGEQVTSNIFTWQGYDLRDPDKGRQRLEGADAPTAENRVRYNASNVVEIHHEAVEVSYSKLAATGQFATTGSNQPNAVGVVGTNPVQNEFAFQTTNQLKQIARDLEKTFIAGTKLEPVDNASPRRTGGLMEATVTNVDDRGTLVGDGGSTIAANGTITETGHGLSVGDWVTPRAVALDAVGVLDDDSLYYVLTAPDANTFTLGKRAGAATITFPGATGTADFYNTVQLTEDILVEVLQMVWEEGGIMVSETATLIANAQLKRRLSKIFITDKNFREETRNVGGVNLQTIETDFGRMNIMLNRHMPSSALQIASLEEVAPAFKMIPDKGFLFVEPLAKVGSADRAQIYGEIGLKYGNEKTHGKILAVRA